MDITVGLVNLLQDFYSCQLLLDTFLNNCSDKDLPKQKVADNILKGKLERVLNLLRKFLRSRDSQAIGFER